MAKLEEVSHEMLVLMLSRVSSRVSGFPVASPCLWGEAAKPILFDPFWSFLKVSNQVVMSFCVAGVVAHRFQKMSFIFRGRRGTLETSIIILHGRRGTLDMSCCVFFCKSRCQGCMHVFTLHTLHFTLHTLHLTLTIALYTPHFTL